MNNSEINKINNFDWKCKLHGLEAQKIPYDVCLDVELWILELFFFFN